MMTARDLTIGYGDRQLLAPSTMTLHEGRLTALLGANGRGKSSLLRTLAGLQKPSGGSIEIGGRDISGLTARETARLITVVTGTAPTAGAFTVTELVELGRQPYTGFFGRLSGHDRAIVDRAIAMTALEELRHRHVATLSDGERQRAMIAKALAQQTPVIILDEPTAFLDVANRLDLLTVLRRLATEENKAVLLSTHDVAATLNVASDLWLMVPDKSAGAESRMISGPAHELIADGSLGLLFPDRAVEFDATRLDFIPRQPGRAQAVKD